MILRTALCTAVWGAMALASPGSVSAQGNSPSGSNAETAELPVAALDAARAVIQSRHQGVQGRPRAEALAEALARLPRLLARAAADPSSDGFPLVRAQAAQIQTLREELASSLIPGSQEARVFQGIARKLDALFLGLDEIDAQPDVSAKRGRAGALLSRVRGGDLEIEPAPQPIAPMRRWFQGYPD